MIAKGSLRRVMRRSFAGLMTAVAVLLGVMSPDPATPQQMPGNASELLQVFQNLSPEQQQAIMKQLGGGGGEGGLGALLGGTATLGGNAPDRQGTLNRRADASQQQQRVEDEEEAEEQLPGLKASDWVVIQTSVETRLAIPTAAAATSAPAAPVIPPALAGGAAGANSAALASLMAATATAPTAATAPSDVPSASIASAQSATSAPLAAQEEDAQRLQALVELIRSRNPYQLSHEGELSLPGFAPIPLLGLSDEQATLRLTVEPGLRGLNIRLTRLPLRKTGVAALRPFGYDIFTSGSAPSSFAPVANVPVPEDYVIGPGDMLNLQIYGDTNRSLRLTVERDGYVNLPELGPMRVAGEHFTTVKEAIEARFEQRKLGVHASVSMADTRALHVFVLGSARRPGSYSLSGLASITTALYASGGVKRTGSLRNIELRRQGSLVRRLDMYDMLIRGDSADDAKLLEGDVVFVPPLGPTVSISGEVQRPAIYEIKGEATVADLVRLAGGLTANADASKAMLTGFDTEHRRVVLAVDPTTHRQVLHNGDLLSVARLRPTIDSGIVLQGYLYAPGAFAWRSGIRLTDVIHSVDELRPNADLHYLLIRREIPPDRHVTVLSADLAAALAAPDSAANPHLMARDRITVFDLTSGRDHIIGPVLDELRLQGNADQPSQVVNIDGRVKVPGEYPLEPGMTVADLIRAGGGTTDAAYGGNAELIRYQVVNGETRRTQLFNVDLAAALRGNPVANLKLQPFDTLSVKEVPEWESQEHVVLRGEVRFPGTYAIRRGETLKSVLGRAGGLTKYAFPDGSVFTREELRRLEQEQLDMLADRMQRDVALLALQSAAANQAGAATALSVGQSLLGQLKGARAVGRLVIDLPRLERSSMGSTYDVVLRAGDTLAVPRYEQQVTVIGEVQNVTSHLYNPKLERDDYINLSGGVTRRADRSKIYIVRANGSVIASGKGSRWFDRGSSVPIKPGDTIVVPLDTEHIPPLPLWTQVTQILYNIAVAVLAIRGI